MEIGVVFTAHPNPIEEPYPHRDVIPAFRPPAERVAAAE
jgi:hypothetical protein